MVNVAQVRDKCNEQFDNRIKRLQKEVQTRDDKISRLRADLEAINQSIR